MRKLVFIGAILALTLSCKENKNTDAAVNTSDDTLELIAQYAEFGASVSPENVMSSVEAIEKFDAIKPGDTVALKFSSKVNEVCQSKGCWMVLDMGKDEAMVKFKDYGFFVPKDIAGEEVIVEGVAFVAEVSVEEQRHYAEDAGKSKEEIEAITEPKRTLSFLSSGVLVPEKE